MGQGEVSKSRVVMHRMTLQVSEIESDLVAAPRWHVECFLPIEAGPGTVNARSACEQPVVLDGH